MCVLRAYGKQFDVDTCMSKSKLKPCLVYHRGEPKTKTKKYRWSDSGINVPVSNAAYENFRRQVKDAIQFLIKNKEEIKKLKKFKGVDGVQLDFPVAHDHNKFIQEYFFPAELIAIAATLSLGLGISEYPESNE